MKSQNNFDAQKEVLDKLADKIEKECGLKNGAWILTFIMLFIDMKTWIVDKTYLAKLYQAIDIVEKSDELKLLYQKVDKE